MKHTLQRTQWRLGRQAQREMASRYERGDTMQEVANAFACSIAAVQRALKTFNVPSRPRREHTIRADFFAGGIATEAQAYWLGFLGADGYVQRDGYCVTLALARQDREHLLALRATLGSTAPVQDYKGLHGALLSRCHFCSKLLSASLSALGVTARKSFTAVPWTGPDDLLRHHFRGWFDGDGSVSLSGKDGWEVGLVGSYETVAAFAQFVARKTGFVRPVRPSKSIFSVRYAVLEEMQAVLHLLYDGATVFLPRKLERAERLWAVQRLRNHRDLSWVTADTLAVAKEKEGTWKGAAVALGIAPGSVHQLRRRLVMLDR